MDDAPPSTVTELLQELRRPGADTNDVRSRLYDTLYPELKKVAVAVMGAERPDHTLQPTALVHEAFLRLVGRDRLEWKDRSHFLGVATRAMRQVLVDHARRRSAAKRGGGRDRVTLHEAIEPGTSPVLEILDLDRALERLAALDARMARVAELRIFGGLTRQEIGEVLSVSVRTVAEDWAVARRWLARELSDGSPA